MARFPPDRAVLLLAARGRIDERTQARLADLLAAPIRWRALLAGARHHGLSSLLADRLQASGLADRVPPEARSQLFAARDEVVAANLLYRDEFRVVVSALMEADIPVIALKGIALAERLYDHLGQRPMIDLDLLVQPENVPRSVSILSDLGYRPRRDARAPDVGPDFEAAPWPSAQPRAKHRQFRRARAGLNSLLELHWTLEHASGAERLAALWRRSEESMVAGLPCRLLGRDDQFVHLLAHFGLHGLGQLLWLSDLDRLVARSPQADWTSIGRMAREANLRLPAASAAHCLRSWLGRPLPDVLGSPGALRRAAMDRALASDGAEPGVPNRYWLALCQWLNVEGPCRRAGAVWRWLFPSEATMARVRGVPRERAALARALRPFRLARAIVDSRRGEWR